MVDILINHVMKIIVTFIFSCFIYFFKQYTGLKNGLKSIIKNEIIRIYEKYSNLGYCPSYMKDNASEMYSSYHKLKGNGMITSMMDEIYKLPNEIKEW